jgi:parvulin-like peptidyl-prolyl isomerase
MSKRFLRKVPRTRTRALAAAGFLCLGLLQGCRCREDGSGIVARVNGEPISFAEFWDEFKSRYEEVTDLSTLPPEEVLGMKGEALSDLIRKVILLQEARKRGIRMPAEALDERIEEISKGYPGKTFQKFLLNHQQDEDLFRKAVEEQGMIEALYREVVAEVGDVTEEEIAAYYDDNLDEFLVPETVRMRQLLVKDRALAWGLLDRLRRGEDFATLAREHASAMTQEHAGTLETYRRGELPRVLELIAFSADEGRVTGPVETPYGFHLFKVEGKVSAHLPALAEVREEIARSLRQQKEEDRYAQWVETLVGNSSLQVHESLKDAILDRPSAAAGQPTAAR